MNWFKPKAKPKEQHRMQEEWDRFHSPLIPNSEPDVVQRVPPSCIGGLIPVKGDATLPVSHYTGLPYDPEWGTQFLHLLYRSGEAPRPRVDPKLIGDDYR